MTKIRLLYWCPKTGNPIDDFFAEKPEYYYFFGRASEEFEFRVAYGKEAHVTENLFRDVWKLEQGRLVPAEKEFRPDIIYQRKRLTETASETAPAKTINLPEFRLSLSRDKFEVYNLLKEFSPETRLAHSVAEIQDAINATPGDQVVIKPRHGQEGIGVFVWDKKKTFSGEHLIEEKLKNGGYLVQVFADTSIGIPGVVSGVHDVKFLNIGDAVFANLRTPGNDGVICVFASPYTEVPVDILPPEMLQARKHIYDRISEKFPQQLFSIDMGNTANGPVLFEINGHTAFPYIHFSYTPAFVTALLKHLQTYATQAPR